MKPKNKPTTHFLKIFKIQSELFAQPKNAVFTAFEQGKYVFFGFSSKLSYEEQVWKMSDVLHGFITDFSSESENDYFKLVITLNLLCCKVARTIFQIVVFLPFPFLSFPFNLFFF